MAGGKGGVRNSVCRERLLWRSAESPSIVQHNAAGRRERLFHGGHMSDKYPTSFEAIQSVRLRAASVEFIQRKLAMPLVLSTGAIEEVTEARAAVTVRVGEAEATGRGAIYLSDLWAWPDATLSHAHRDATLRRLSQEIAGELPALCGEPAHPLELGLRLHERLCAETPTPGWSESLPVLARAMCLSPFDAAIHDAAGVALGVSAFAFYDRPARIRAADDLFPGEGAAAAVRRMLRIVPQREFPACLVVSKGDDLASHLRHWVRDRGYRRVKLKLSGADNGADVARTVEVDRALRGLGIESPWISVDTNEANADAASVLDYLERLRAADASAYAAIVYLEQPTARDIRSHRFDWRPVTRHKPVLLDEGLTDFAGLAEAASQGWSGLALKTCKGHSFALVAAAWAKKHGMMCSLQDLTNPGYAAIHAALFAAFVPTINGVELNSPQFTPEANAEWLPELAPLLEPRDGVHRLPAKTLTGLGWAVEKC